MSDLATYRIDKKSALIERVALSHFLNVWLPIKQTRIWIVISKMIKEVQTMTMMIMAKWHQSYEKSQSIFFSSRTALLVITLEHFSKYKALLR